MSIENIYNASDHFYPAFQVSMLHVRKCQGRFFSPALGKTRRIGGSFFFTAYTARYESINLLITGLCSTRGDREAISVCAKYRYLVRVRLGTNTKRDTTQSTRDRYKDPENNSITCHVETRGAIRGEPFPSISTCCRETDRLTSSRIKRTHSALRVLPIS